MTDESSPAEDESMVVFEFAVPAETFVLEDALREHPEVVVEIERLAQKRVLAREDNVLWTTVWGVWVRVFCRDCANGIGGCRNYFDSIASMLSPFL